MANEGPRFRSGWEIPWGCTTDLIAGLIYLGIGYVASFLFEQEWHVGHYLMLLAVLALVVGAIRIYRRSRQTLP